MDTRRSVRRAKALIISVFVLVVCIAGATIWAITKPSAPKEEFTAPPQTMLTQTPEDPLKYAVDVSDVDRKNREQVARKFAEIATTWYPAKDFNKTQAVFRAAALLTPEKAQELIVPERPHSGAEWLQWGQRDGYTVPSVNIREPLHGAESDEIANAFVNTEAEVVYRWKAEGFESEYVDEQWIYYMAMTQDKDGNWSVGDFTYEILPLKQYLKTTPTDEKSKDA